MKRKPLAGDWEENFHNNPTSVSNDENITYKFFDVKIDRSEK